MLDDARTYPSDGVDVIRLLSEEPLWAAWHRNGLKVPINPHTGNRAKVNRPNTWGTYEEAQSTVEKLRKEGHEAGLGTMLGPLQGFPDWYLGGIDLDGCRDPETGQLEPWAQDVVDRFNTYTESSPSGKGVHILFVCRDSDREALKAEGLIKPGATWGADFKGEPGTEIAPRLCGGKFLTFTDNPTGWPAELIGSASVMAASRDDLRWLFGKHGPDFQSRAGASTSGNGSRSEDLFAFFCQKIEAGVDRETAIEQLWESDNPGLDHAREQADPERAINRGYENAKQTVEEERARQYAALINQFDELPEEPPEGVDPVVWRLNQVFSVVQIPGGTAIARIGEDGEFDLLTWQAFSLQLRNKFVLVGEKRIPLAKYWVEHPKRREYRGIFFDPSGRDRPGYLNLWRGWGVVPDPNASCERFLYHLKNVICNGDPEAFDYAVKWMAHTVRYPSEKPGVALVLIGGKGVGKDMALSYFGDVMRPSQYKTVFQPRHVLGNFNAPQECCLLMHMQEGFFAGNKSDGEVLKALITSERVMIERKGIDAFGVDSFMRLAITSNNIWVVPASGDERRYAVFNCGPRREDDYYKALAEERENGGPAAFLAHLQGVDLSGFNVRRAPETDGLNDQKLESLEGIPAWWRDKLESGHLPGMNPTEQVLKEDNEWKFCPLEIEVENLRQDYADWNHGRRGAGNPPGPEGFGKQLRKVCPGLVRCRGGQEIGRAWCYRIPHLQECIAAFEKTMGVTLKRGDRES